MLNYQLAKFNNNLLFPDKNVTQKVHPVGRRKNKVSCKFIGFMNSIFILSSLWFYFKFYGVTTNLCVGLFPTSLVTNVIKRRGTAVQFPPVKV